MSIFLLVGGENLFLHCQSPLISIFLMILSYDLFYFKTNAIKNLQVEFFSDILSVSFFRYFVPVFMEHLKGFLFLL